MKPESRADNQPVRKYRLIGKLVCFCSCPHSPNLYKVIAVSPEKKLETKQTVPTEFGTVGRKLIRRKQANDASFIV